MTAATAGERRRPLRIAYINNSLDLGGSERQMLMLARHLPRDRFQVEFIMLARPGVLAPEAEAAGVVMHVLGGRSRRSAPFPVWAWHTAGTLLAFIRLIRRRRYDVVDAWLFTCYVFASVTRPFTRVPVLISGRRSLSDYKEEFGLLKRLAERLARATSDAFVANADAVAGDVRRREGIVDGRLRVIHNGVEPPAPMLPAERRRIRGGWGVEDDAATLIGCVANYKPGKGHEVLIEAFARTVQGRNVRLVLIGEGRLRETLARQIADRGLTDRVVLAGSVPDPRPLYAAFDIGVLASESEGLPNGLLEAAAAGLSTVTTDAGGAREVVVDGATGFVVPVGDHDALASALGRLVDDADLRRRFGAAARARIATEFGVERCVEAFGRLYEELASSRAGLP